MESANTPALLRGELYKAGDGSTTYKLRWFELWPLGRGELRWAEQEGVPGRAISDLRGSVVTIGPDDALPNTSSATAKDRRFPFKLAPRGSSRVYALQASSPEERRLWVDAIETLANPGVHRVALGGSYRIIKLPKPVPPQLWGIDLGSAPGLPCVTVLECQGAEARAAGLLAGDVVLSVDHTVLRTATVAARVFREAALPASRRECPVATLRLATHNREVTLRRRDGRAGFNVINPPQGAGTIISKMVPGGAGEACGLHVGDRILAVNGRMIVGGSADFARRLERATGNLSLVVSGFTTEYVLRKDANGLLGMRCSDSPGGGAPVVSDVIRSTPAKEAGLRSGDTIVAANGEPLFGSAEITDMIRNSSRSVRIVVWRPRQPDASSAQAGGRDSLGGGGRRSAVGGLDGGGRKSAIGALDTGSPVAMTKSGRFVPPGAAIEGAADAGVKIDESEAYFLPWRRATALSKKRWAYEDLTSVNLLTGERGVRGSSA